jgi:hypothetical protein
MASPFKGSRVSWQLVSSFLTRAVGKKSSRVREFNGFGVGFAGKAKTFSINYSVLTGPVFKFPVNPCVSRPGFFSFYCMKYIIGQLKYGNDICFLGEIVVECF